MSAPLKQQSAVLVLQEGLVISKWCLPQFQAGSKFLHPHRNRVCAHQMSVVSKCKDDKLSNGSLLPKRRVNGEQEKNGCVFVSWACASTQ